MSTPSADPAVEARDAQTFLAALDDPIAWVARDHGPVDFTLPSRGLALADDLERLTLGIVGQLISVRAALVIFGRLRDLCGGRIDAAERALAWGPYRSYAAKYLWLHYAAATGT